MNQGKIICEILKEIRTRIAHENEIPFYVEECTFDGECKGTCPRCEAELTYLEKKIHEFQSLITFFINHQWNPVSLIGSFIKFIVLVINELIFIDFI